jgi:hypothetical protein
MDIIVDIDGTLADVEHRRHHIVHASGTPELFPDWKPDWKAFAAAMMEDEPVWPVVALVRILHTAGCRILLCSGRNAEDIYTTMVWLDEHKIPHNELFVRKHGDHRPDHEVKLDMLDTLRDRGYDPQIVIDDRNSVVAMWRQNGLTCLQAAPGDF